MFVTLGVAVAGAVLVVGPVDERTVLLRFAQIEQVVDVPHGRQLDKHVEEEHVDHDAKK